MMNTIDLIATIFAIALTTPLTIAMISLMICELAPTDKVPQWLEDFTNRVADLVDRVLSTIF